MSAVGLFFFQHSVIAPAQVCRESEGWAFGHKVDTAVGRAKSRVSTYVCRVD